MRKYFLTAVIVLFFTTSSYAGFNFGSDTYENVDNILIVNSLGDQTVESKFEHNGLDLGFNDYIPENAFKNDLYNQGYTSVFDYADVSLDLVEVGYMGVRGDPRSYDADYVLRKEYEKYSSQYQDIRIDKNKTNISNNKGNITTNKKNIKTNKKHIATNKTNIKTNKKNISVNKKNIKINKKEIKRVDKKQTNWNNKQDKKINTNKTGIKTNRKSIKKNANNITNNTNNISSNSNRINDLDTRVKGLEQTQVIVGGEIVIKDTRKWKTTLFADYSTTRSKFDRVGVRFQYKFGISWQEKEFEKLNKKIKQLEEKL